MGTTLDTPVPQPDITNQAITQVRFQIPHKLSPDETQIIIDKDNVSVSYTVTTFNEDLVIENNVSETALWPTLPAVFKTELRAVYDRLVSDAKSKGLIDPGTDEPLI